jgi:hypothetical protein
MRESTLTINSKLISNEHSPNKIRKPNKTKRRTNMIKTLWQAEKENAKSSFSSQPTTKITNRQQKKINKIHK